MEQGEVTCPLSRGEKILVALDGSANSDRALDQALSMAGVCNSKIFVISVVDIFPETIEIAPAIEEKASEKVRKLLQKAKARAAKENIPCETIAHMGPQPHEFIVQEAKEKGIDLIIMGTHGRTGLKKLLMGSVTQKVIGHAPCAVMVIPG